MTKRSQEERGGKKHTTLAQRLDMVIWLENSENRRLICGENHNKKPIISGMKLKKVDGYKALAEYINRRHNVGWDTDTAKSRFESYMRMYKVKIKVSIKDYLRY